MTSCQRPKECEPSRYRHGSDPPKQVETGPFSDRKALQHLLRLPHNPFHPTQSSFIETGTMSGPNKRRSLPCHRQRSLSLFQVPRKNRYSFCRRSEQQFMLTDAVALGVMRCLLTESRLMRMERRSLAQPESLQRPVKSAC